MAHDDKSEAFRRGVQHIVNVLDHKAALALIEPEERAALTERSDGAGLRHLAGHAALIAAMSALILAGWRGAVLGQGIALAFLFALLHETTHQTPFRTAWLNKSVGALCAAILVIPPVWFHSFHMAHHRWTQIPGKDPELARPAPEGWPRYLLHISGLPLWQSLLRILIRNARGICDDDFVPEGKRGPVRAEARAMLVLYAALGVSLLWSPWVFWLWILPMLVGQPFLRLYLLAEHKRCAFVANMLENTRSTASNRAVRWLAWNMPYHAEHHAYPAVPFHKLPALHRHLAPYLQETSPSYTAFHRRFTADFAKGDRHD